jgi:orotate phosphoribosyltransferase
MQCALVLQKPWVAEKLCQALAAKIKTKPDVVVGPAMGGIYVAHEMARAFKTRCLFTERGEDKKMTLRRGFSIKPGEKVLVVEDVITTGKSTGEVIEILKQKGGVLTGVASIVDRSEGQASFGVPFDSLLKIHIDTYSPADCPLCREGKTPAIKPGSRPGGAS